MSFTSDLSDFQKKTQSKMDRVKRKSALDLFTIIVFRTPVDKGVLRNNWFASINTPTAETTTGKDIAGQATIAKIKRAVADALFKDPIFFTNNLPYSVPIEFDGHSAQAPEGMVRVSLPAWNSIVRNNAREIVRQ